MKICSPQLGLSPYSDLGGEVHDYNLLTKLAFMGNSIYVYLPKSRETEKNKNIFISRAPYKHIPAISFNLISLPYLFKSYGKHRFDILRIHNPYFLGIAAMLFKIFNNKVPIVATYHLKEENFIYNCINSLFAQKFDAIVVVSNYLKKWLVKKFRINPNKIHVIYNGVGDEFKPEDKSINLIRKYKLQNKHVLLYMGLLTNRKNPMFLLEIYKRLKLKNKNIALIICGRGPLKKQMESKILSENIKDVIITGQVVGENKVKHMNICDVFVSPSANEGFGLSVAEAMACAKPVIVANNTSLAEIVEGGQSGLLANDLDLKDWIDKLELLIKNSDIRKKIGTAALIRSKLFSWEISAAKHADLYTSLINDKKSFR